MPAGTRTTHGSPCAAQGQELAQERLLSPPVQWWSHGGNSHLPPAPAAALSCGSGNAQLPAKPGPASQPARLLPALVPEKPFAAQQVLEIPGTARDGPFRALSLSQHPPGATVGLWQHQPPLPQGPCPHQQQPLPMAQFWPQWTCPRVWAPGVGWAVGAVPTELLGASTMSAMPDSPALPMGEPWALSGGGVPGGP